MKKLVLGTLFAGVGAIAFGAAVSYAQNAKNRGRAIHWNYLEDEYSDEVA